MHEIGQLEADGLVAAPLDVSFQTEALLVIPVPPVSPDPLQGPKWPTTSVTWSFAASNLVGQPGGTTFSSFMTDPAIRGVVQKAMALWAAVSGLSLVQVADAAGVGIRIGFEALNSASTGTIGLTNSSSSGGLFRNGTTVGLEDPAAVALTALPDGDFGYSGYGTHLFQVVVHEIGHALGLAHNAVDAAAVMNAVGTAADRSIDANDAAAIELLYGGSSTALAALSLTNPGPVRFNVAAGGTVNPFANLAVASGAGLYEAIRIIVTGGGTLSDPVAGTNAAFSGGVFTESGVNLTASDHAQTVLRRLVYTAPAAGGAASFALVVDNSLQGSAADSSISVGAALPIVPPTITSGGGNLLTTDALPVTPFGGLVIGDTNAGQTEQVTVTFSALGNGTLSNLGGGSYSAATGVYQVSGSAAAVTTALQGLLFTPTRNQVAPGSIVTTGFTIGVVDTALATASLSGSIFASGTVPVTFSIAASGATKAEGNSGVTLFGFAVSRGGDSSTSVSVGYSVAGAGSNPANAADFPGGAFPMASTVTLGAGETSRIIMVPVAGDTVVEADETFVVTLSGPSTGSIVSATAAGTILNDDSPVVATFSIGVGFATAFEGNSGTTPFTFQVTRTGDLSGSQTVTYAVAGSGANPANAADFGGVLPTGSVVFAANESLKVVTVNVSGDTKYEADEGFTVSIAAPPGAVVTTGSASGTIQNDEPGLAVGVVDGTTHASSLVNMDSADIGGPSYLQSQYIYAGSDDLAVSTQAPNVFLHTGGGNDAVQVSAGQNVLDGGLGSNFLTGGSGTDTFFTDARAAGVVWNTLRNFHAGDAATLWGFTGVSSFRWEANVAGAAGSEGATLRANIVGGSGRTGDGIDASITFTGLSVAQAQRLQFATGQQPAGSYLYIYNPGV